MLAITLNFPQNLLCAQSSRASCADVVSDNNNWGAPHDGTGDACDIAALSWKPLSTRTCHKHESSNIAREGERESRLDVQAHGEVKHGVNVMTVTRGEVNVRQEAG